MIPAAAFAKEAALGNSAWEKAATFQVKEAYGEFKQNKEMGPLEKKFGIAVTLLNLQPRTQGNLEESARLFGELAGEVPKGEPLNAFARFFRARLMEFYFDPPDTEAARQEYLALVKEGTGNLVVELSASQLVVLEGFSEKSLEERLAGLAELEGLAADLKTPSGQREFHTAMGYALLSNGGDKAKALDHFLAADKIGFPRKTSASALWLTAGTVAAEIGRTGDAKYFFEKMIEVYPHDPRIHMVKQRLESLKNG